MDKDKLRKESQDLFDTYRAKLGNKSSSSAAALRKCFDGFKDHFDDCSDYRTQNSECLKAGQLSEQPPPPPDSKAAGLHGSQITMAQGSTTQANCEHAMDHCFRRGRGHVNNVAPRLDDCSSYRGSGWEVISAFYTEADKLQQKQATCWRQNGDQHETDARQRLLESQTTAALDCINSDDANRVCKVSPDGSKFTEVPKDQMADTSSARLGSAADPCTATALGDGQTAVTAGHCVQNNQNPKLTIVDGNGNSQTLTANCSTQYTKSLSSDMALCQLSRPIQVSNSNPVYVATLDPNQSSGCSTTGYVKRCAPDYFQGLSNSTYGMYAYAAQTDPATNQQTSHMVWTQGNLYYDPGTSQLYSYNTLCTHGCSGAGIIVNDNGQSVLLAPLSQGDPEQQTIAGPAIPSSVFDQLQVQSVSHSKLTAGTHLFQMMQ